MKAERRHQLQTNELARQLAELAGPDAIIRVDSFEGQQLPPKAQIKSIHVTRDQFAAEAAQPGSTFVDVVTQPGVGPIRGTTNFSLRASQSAMNWPLCGTAATLLYAASSAVLSIPR